MTDPKPKSRVYEVSSYQGDILISRMLFSSKARAMDCATFMAANGYKIHGPMKRSVW